MFLLICVWEILLWEGKEGKFPLRETLMMSLSTLQCDRLDLFSSMINSRCVQLKSLYTVDMWILLESYMIHVSTLTSVWFEAHAFDQRCQCTIRSSLGSYTFICTFVEVWLQNGWSFNQTSTMSSGSLVETSTKLPLWLVEVWWKFGWNFNQTSTMSSGSLVEVWMQLQPNFHHD